MAHRVQDAIMNLQKHKFFKEAVSICHLRLSADDPLLKETICAWGKYSQDNGNYDIAVQWYFIFKSCLKLDNQLPFPTSFISVGDYDKAALVLAKRKDPKMWQLGIYLAKRAGANELFVTMTIDCFYYCMMNQEWNAAKELISNIENMKVMLKLLNIFFD